MAEEFNREMYGQEMEKIDILDFLSKAWKMFKKTWLLLIVFAAVGMGIFFGYNKMFYEPEYEAFASFSVAGNSGYTSYTSDITLSQLNATFPYILESGALKDVIMEDLGLDTLPGTITASVLGDTNLFQISVVSGDAQMAYDILESVIENYPTVAKYVIGDTTLTMLDNSGVPTSPRNGVSLWGELKKGAMVGILVYLAVLALMTILRKTVTSEEDLKKYTSVRCLANIPRTYLKRRSGKKQKLMLIDQRSVMPAFVEAVSTLRVRTARLLKGGKQQVILVTSSSEGEGKTTITANLALAYAMKGYRVLLIDGDLRHPSVRNSLGMASGAGLAQVIEGSAKAAETIERYAKTHLHVLAGSSTVNHTKITGILGSDNLKLLMNVLRKEYDYIFIDTPPCGMMQDAAMLSEVSDCAVMVIRQDYIARDRVLSAMEMLAETGITLMGYVINSEETGIGSYGYGRYGYGKYGYGQYGKYGKYGSDEQPVSEKKVSGDTGE